MVQNRRMAAEGIVMPSCGMSLSRKVRMNPSRHAMLSESTARQVRARKSAPQPEPHPRLDSRLREIESRQLDELDPAGQRLGDTTHEFG